MSSLVIGIHLQGHVLLHHVPVSFLVGSQHKDTRVKYASKLGQCRKLWVLEKLIWILWECIKIYIYKEYCIQHSLVE